MGREWGPMFNGDLLHNLHTLDCLVYKVQNISVNLAKETTLTINNLRHFTVTAASQSEH